MSFTVFFFFNDTAPTEIYTLSLHDALPISRRLPRGGSGGLAVKFIREMIDQETATAVAFDLGGRLPLGGSGVSLGDRKSTRLNSSHSQISYAVFCLKKKNHYFLFTILVPPP